MTRTRQKSSPNMAPPTPAKIPVKYQPQPVSLITDLVIKGNHILQTEQTNNEKLDSKTGNIRFGHSNTHYYPHPRPHSAHVDKHVLKSLSRSPSVDSSFYDKFERKDADANDVNSKQKACAKNRKSSEGVSKRKPRPASARVRSARKREKPRRRSKSANPVLRCQPNPNIVNTYYSNSTSSKHRNSERPKSAGSQPKHRSAHTGSFLETVMSFDDQTKQNTLSNAIRHVSPRTVLGKAAGRNSVSNSGSAKNRPMSGNISLERSASKSRDSRRDSIGSSSVVSSSSTINRSRKRDKILTRRPNSRKSRSRTRRNTNTNHRTRPQKNSSTQDNNFEYSSEKRAADRREIVVQTINALPNDELVSAPMKNKIGNFAYHYAQPQLKNTGKSSAARPKRIPRATSPINAVEQANIVVENSHELKRRPKRFPKIENDMDLYSSRRYVSSSIPRLKMMVVPTATPMTSTMRLAGVYTRNLHDRQ